MKMGFQLGAWFCGLGLSATLLVPYANAQGNPSNDRPPARQQAPPPQQREANRPPPRNDRPQGSYHPQGPRPYDNRRDTRPQAAPPNVQERLRNMSPQDRQRLAQNEQRLRSLSPAQQQELRDRARVWQKMTPEQREHIRNDVLPKWKQLLRDLSHQHVGGAPEQAQVQ